MEVNWYGLSININTLLMHIVMSTFVINVDGCHAGRVNKRFQSTWNMSLVVQFINCFKSMVLSENLLFKLILDKFYLGLLTCMQEIQCTGICLSIHVMITHFCFSWILKAWRFCVAGTLKGLTY